MLETPRPSFRLYKQPFLMLTTSLSCGILIGFEFEEWSKLFLLCGLLLLIGFLVIYALGIFKNYLFFGFVITGFILIGAFLMQSREGLWQETQFNESYEKNDLLLVKLRDVGQSDKTWKKMTGEIVKIYHNTSEISHKEPVVLFIKTENSVIESGDVLLISSELNEITNPGNPGEFNAKNYWNKKGFRFMSFVGNDQFQMVQHFDRPWLSQKLTDIRAYLTTSLERNLSGKELAIALALILGDKSQIDQEITTSFTNTGAMHVLAVSGLHIGIIMQLLMAILSQFARILSRKNAIIIVVVIMWIYAFITGLSPSVLRAVFMFSILVLSELSGKNHNSINSLFFTAFVLILVDPYTLYDIGFQLSFLAMLGIFLFYKQIDQVIFIQNKWLKKVWQGTAIGFAAQLMTTPLSLYYFHQFPNYFVLTNIGLMASSGLILGLGIWIFSISWWTAFARISGVILSFIIFISLWFIEWVEDLPGAVAYGFEVSISLVFFSTVLILILFLYVKKQIHYFFAFSIGLLFLSIIVIKRYDNHTKNEICVFNTRQIIITIRKDNKLFCFYKAKKEDFDKVEYAVEGYRKLHPAEIQYFPLDEKDWAIKSLKTAISTKYSKGNVLINVNDKQYSILQSDFNAPTKKAGILIGMPWIETPCDHFLKNGAFVKAI
jgi:competence protein ComEC